MRRLHFISVALGLSCLAGCATPESATSFGAFDPLIESRAQGRVQVSVLVRSLVDNRVIYARRPSLLMRPASTMKLVTTIPVALRRPDLEVVTRMQAIDRESGTLWLIGGADPLLSSEDLATMVARLHAGGMRRVTRLEYLDPMAGRPRFGQGWMWDDEPAAYMPHLSGLTVDGGTVTVVVRRDGAGEKIAVSPASAHTPVLRMNGAHPLTITRDWRRGRSAIEVSGTLSPGEEKRRSLSVPDSATHTAQVLKDLLIEAGMADETCEVAPASAPPASPLAHDLAHFRRLPELLAAANKPSDNLTAEMLLRHLGTRGATLGTAVDGHRVVAEVLTSLGIAEADYRLADGSGVSHYNLISADLLVRLLRAAWRHSPATRALVHDSLAIAGVDGTLSRRMRGTPAAKVVHAKTGTISAVSTIAGYAKTASGEDVAFAILVQNYTGSSRPWRDLQDELLVDLVGAR